MAKSEENSNVASTKRRKRTWSAPSSTVHHLHYTNNQCDYKLEKRSVQKYSGREAIEKEELETFRVREVIRELTRLFPSRSCDRKKIFNNTFTVKRYSNQFIEKANNAKSSVASLTKNDSVSNIHESKNCKSNGEVIQKNDTTKGSSKSNGTDEGIGYNNEEVSDKGESCTEYNSKTNGMKILDNNNNNNNILENKNIENCKLTIPSIIENSLCNSCDISNHKNIHNNSEFENDANLKEILLTNSNVDKQMHVEEQQRKIETLDVMSSEEALQSEGNGSEAEALKAKLEMTIAQVQLSNAVIERNINNWNVIEKENKWLKEENCMLKKKVEELKYELDAEKSKVKEQINIIRTLQRELSESKKEYEKFFSKERNLNTQIQI